MDTTERDIKEIRKFAVTLFFALAVLGGLILWRRGQAGLFFWMAGVSLLVVGLIKPAVLKPIQKAWMTLATYMGFVSTHIILAITYYVVFTPVGLVMRVLGRDPLRLRHTGENESYWIRREQTEFRPEIYERMF
jgi:hypothetical protein